MNNMIQVSTKIFEFGKYPVRTIDSDGQVWFVAKDIAEILGYSDTEKMTRRLDEDEKLTSQIGASGQIREMVIINESGLYNAVIGSKKENARSFKKWITSEVLPSIRRTGGYSLTGNILDAQFQEQALIIAKRSWEDVNREINAALDYYVGKDCAARRSLLLAVANGNNTPPKEMVSIAFSKLQKELVDCGKRLLAIADERESERISREIFGN